ncbi:hypothetical protein K488DRAFT_71545 [Vararia minispora EC-137]|uniref:Uncharacterized protein n=1 Tax=Vararia minispora EC-137 TaxID=1314806 RepID=A0ACB8QHD7_9AGAM|nr:hypothetical protein K488DRAFT_71545 [Vararia minispora EC-137]
MLVKAPLLAALIPLAAALTLNTPGSSQAGESITISWTSATGDPNAFTLELVNAPVLLNAIAIANNVPTSQGSVSLTLPIVPSANDYTVQAVNVGNISDIFGQTSNFAIAAAPSAASTTPSSTASVGTLSSASSTVSATAPPIANSASGVLSSASVSATSALGSLSRSGSAAAVSSSSTSPSASTTPTSAAGPAVRAPAGLFAAGAMGLVALVAGLAL